MCGLYGSNDLENGLAWCSSVSNKLLHRGPDAQNIIKKGEYYIGHNRLKIIDISNASNQPLVDDDGKWMLFNGEIFNYLELSLEYNLGNTSSDTIVLFELLKHDGLKVINKLNGFFSIVFFDGVNLNLIRDRFGEKPLYYSLVNRKIRFASELRAFSDAEVDLNFVSSNYQNYVTVDSFEQTHLKDVKSIEPGCFAVLGKDGHLEFSRWYNFQDSEAKVFSSYGEFYNEFLSIFIDSIRIRLRTDVPMVISLSGGIDSASIYCAINKYLPSQNLTAVTYEHPSESTSELSLVKSLVKLFGGNLEIIRGDVVVDEFELNRSIESVEYPIWGPSSVAFNDFYRGVRALGFTCVLEGHGSDELFGGYPHFIEELVMEYIGSGKLFKAHRLYELYKRTVNESVGNTHTLFWNMLLRSLIRPHKFRSEVNRSFERDILPVVLRCFDRVTMYNSLESRSPFLDFRLVELIRNAPNDFVLSEEGTKRPLRDFLRSCGCHDIANRKLKTGFGLDRNMLEINIDDWNNYVIDFFKSKYQASVNER